MDSSHKGSIMQKFDVSFRRHWISCWTNGQWLKTLRSSCDVTVIHQPFLLWLLILTHWGRVTHIRVSNLTIIGSDNGLSPSRRQPVIWTNDGILLIGPLGTNFSEISIGIQTFSLTKMHLKMSSAKWCPFFLGLNVLKWDERLILQNNFRVNPSDFTFEVVYLHCFSFQVIELYIQHNDYWWPGDPSFIQASAPERLNYFIRDGYAVTYLFDWLTAIWPANQNTCYEIALGNSDCNGVGNAKKIGTFLLIAVYNKYHQKIFYPFHMNLILNAFRNRGLKF